MSLQQAGLNEKRYLLYGGEVEMVYDDDLHFYVVNGHPIPSVTKVLDVIEKPGLIRWAINETLSWIKGQWHAGRVYGEEEINNILKSAFMSHINSKEKALGIGTAVHTWIEAFFKSGEQPEMPGEPSVKNCIENFLLWLDDKEVVPLHVEKKIYSREMGYSGTADLIAYINGKLTLCDFKSSKSIHDEYAFQACAYAQAYEEESAFVGTNEKIESIIIVKIPKNAVGYEEKEVAEDREKYMNVFLSALDLFKKLNNLAF